MTIFFDFYVVKDDLENNGAALFYFAKERAKQIEGHISIICCDENGSEKKKKISFSKEEKETWCRKNLEMTGIGIKKVKHPNMKTDFAKMQTVLIDKEPERVQYFLYNYGIGILHTTFESTQNKLAQIFDALEKYPVTDKENEGEQIQQARLRHALDSYRSLQKKEGETLLYEKIRNFSKLFKCKISLDEAKFLWQKKLSNIPSVKYKVHLKRISGVFEICEISSIEKKNLSKEIFEKFFKFIIYPSSKSEWIAEKEYSFWNDFCTDETYLYLLEESNKKVLQLSDDLEAGNTLGDFYDYKKIKTAFTCFYFIRRITYDLYDYEAETGVPFVDLTKDDYTASSSRFLGSDFIAISILCFMLWSYPSVEISRKEIIKLINNPHRAHKYHLSLESRRELDEMSDEEYYEKFMAAPEYTETEGESHEKLVKSVASIMNDEKSARNYSTLAMNLYINKLYEEIDKLRKAEF